MVGLTRTARAVASRRAATRGSLAVCTLDVVHFVVYKRNVRTTQYESTQADIGVTTARIESEAGYVFILPS